MPSINLYLRMSTIISKKYKQNEYIGILGNFLFIR